MVATVADVQPLADTFMAKGTHRTKKRAREEADCCYEPWDKSEPQNTSNANEICGVQTPRGRSTRTLQWSQGENPVRYSSQGPVTSWFALLPFSRARLDEVSLLPLDGIFRRTKVEPGVGLLHLYTNKWQRCELFLQAFSPHCSQHSTSSTSQHSSRL